MTRLCCVERGRRGPRKEGYIPEPSGSCTIQFVLVSLNLGPSVDPDNSNITHSMVKVGYARRCGGLAGIGLLWRELSVVLQTLLVVTSHSVLVVWCDQE